MITPEQHAEIRRLYFGEHWKVGTIATNLGVHHDTVRAAIALDTRAVPRGTCRRTKLDPVPAVYPRDPRAVSASACDAAPRHAAAARLRRVRGASPARSCACCGRSVAAAAVLAASSSCPARSRRSTGAASARSGSVTATRLLSGFVMVLSYSRAAVCALHAGPNARELSPRTRRGVWRVSGRRADLGLRQSEKCGARTRTARRSAFIRGSWNSPGTITSRSVPVRRHAAMRRARSSGRSSTSAMPSSRPGRFGTSTISTRNSAAGATRSRISVRIPSSAIGPWPQVFADEQPRLLPLPGPSLRDRRCCGRSCPASSPTSASTATATRFRIRTSAGP